MKCINKFLYLSLFLLFSSCIKNGSSEGEMKKERNDNLDVSSSVSNLKALFDDSYITGIFIYDKEITDTTFHAPYKKRSLPILEKLVEIQCKNRDFGDEDWYKWKSSQYMSPYASYMISDLLQGRDTMFIYEARFKESGPSISFWNNLDSVYSLNYEARYEIFSCINSKFLNYIQDWRKDEIMSYGRTIYPVGATMMTNPGAICVSRIIKKQNSVRIDMFKCYYPYDL